MSLLNKLIEQAKNPSGAIGKIMVRIMNAAHKKQTIWGLGQLHLQSQSKVLDVGCGGGSTLYLLSHIATEGEIVGVDYSIDAVKHSTRLNRSTVESGLVRAEQGDVEKLPFDSHTFDFVTAVQTHYFWPDMKTSLEEIKRVLCEGGQAMILAEHYKMQYHMDRYETSAKLKELLLEVGFTSVSVKEKDKWMCLIGEC